MEKPPLRLNCPHCHRNISFRSRGGWLNYANGIGPPEDKCPKCGREVPTGRKYWNDLTPKEKLTIYSKMLFVVPAGMILFACLGYLIVTTDDPTKVGQVPLSDKEATDFISTNSWFVILMCFIASLVASLTTLKLIKQANTVKKYGFN